MLRSSQGQMQTLEASGSRCEQCRSRREIRRRFDPKLRLGVGVKKLKHPLKEAFGFALDGSSARIAPDPNVPVADLITFRGTVASRELTALKDDGCNTKVMYRVFVGQNWHLLSIQKCNSIVRHFSKNSAGTAFEMVVNDEVEIGKLRYRSNWILAKCRYDMLLGMSRHIEANPSTDYCTRMVRCGDI